MRVKVSRVSSNCDYLSIQDYARKTGISDKTVRRYIEGGILTIYQPLKNGKVLIELKRAPETPSQRLAEVAERFTRIRREA